MKKFIEYAKEEERMGVILTYKEEKITFYEKFDFKEAGLSPSVHDKVLWNQMRLTRTLSCRTPKIAFLN